MSACPCCGQEVTRPAVLFYEGSNIVALGDRAVTIGAKQRKKMFHALYEAWPRVVSMQNLIGVLWENPADEAKEPEAFVRIQIAHLRDDVRDLGVVVRCERSIGYRLEFPRGVVAMRPKMKAA
jgi:DNA-binding winged helix-turn-helix (wHTH) protein